MSLYLGLIGVRLSTQRYLGSNNLGYRGGRTKVLDVGLSFGLWGVIVCHSSVRGTTCDCFLICRLESVAV